MLKGDPAATRASRKCCVQGDSVNSTGATQAPAQILTELRRANFRLLHLPYLETIRRRSYLRPIWESVEELIRHCLVDESEIQRRLADLAVMDPAAVAVAGGDRLSPYSRCRRAIIDRPSEAGLLGDEPAARRPSPVTTPSARGCGLVSRKSIAKGTLRGFATVELPIELKLVDCPIFVGPNGPWAALPSKPVLDCEGRQARPSGKPQFAPVVEWRNRGLADRFSATVIALVEGAHPDMLSGRTP